MFWWILHFWSFLYFRRCFLFLLNNSYRLIYFTPWSHWSFSWLFLFNFWWLYRLFLLFNYFRFASHWSSTHFRSLWCFCCFFFNSRFFFFDHDVFWFFYLINYRFGIFLRASSLPFFNLFNNWWFSYSLFLFFFINNRNWFRWLFLNLFLFWLYLFWFFRFNSLRFLSQLWNCWSLFSSCRFFFFLYFFFLFNHFLLRNLLLCNFLFWNFFRLFNFLFLALSCLSFLNWWYRFSFGRYWLFFLFLRSTFFSFLLQDRRRTSCFLLSSSW